MRKKRNTCFSRRRISIMFYRSYIFFVRGRNIAISILVGLLLLSIPTSASGVLTAEPSKLVFDNAGDKVLVRLLLDGEPLAASNVKGWTLLAGERSYTHMISITPTSDGLLIGPSATAEVGTYVLVINTRKGSVHIDVSTPFADHESILEKTVRELGVSEDEARAQLGFSQQFERGKIALNLPSTYYTGDMLEIEVPQNGEHRCVWKINGNTVLEGIGQTVLRQMITVAGPMEVTYEEWNDSTLLSTTSAQCQVLQRPAINLETTVNATTTFRGPANYERYSWYVENEMCCHQPAINHVFDKPGIYHVMCVSSQPLDPSLKESREDVFEVTVR